MLFKNIWEDKYSRLEILFFVTYYIGFSILSSVEYSLLERKDVSLSFKDFPSQLFNGLKAILPAVFFYKVIIQRFLFNRRYLWFCLGLLLYLVCLNFYNLYGYLLVWKVQFFPDVMRENAARWYNNDAFMRFSIIYMFREFLVLTALAYFIRSGRQEVKLKELQTQQMATELNYLKTQIQPHFFFNTLNNIYSLTLQKSDKAAPLVSKHAEIMRYILNSNNSSFVGLQKEIEFIENYIQVESIRYSDKIDIQLEVQGVDHKLKIAPLLLLPFVENAFKHGIGEETEQGFILIVVSQVANELSVEVKNSKSNTVVSSAAGGFGLMNVRKRLALLYTDKYSLEVIDDENVHTVYLTVKLTQHD